MVAMKESDIQILSYPNFTDTYRIVLELEELPKRRRKSVAEVEVRVGDPVEKLGSDLMRKIFGLLDARDLGSALLVNRIWFHLSSSDSLWSPLCDQLWLGKAHIPRWSKVPGISKLTSYSRAVNDSSCHEEGSLGSCLEISLYRGGPKLLERS